MNIRNLVIVLLSALFLIASCVKDKDTFQVKGKISHSEGKMIYFEELKVASAKMLDSAKIDKNGEFIFTGKTSAPTYYLLKLSDKKFITLLIDSLEQVMVVADAANFEKSYSVEGSSGSLLVKALSDRLLNTRKKLDSIQSLENLYKGNPDYHMMRREWSVAKDSLKKAQTEFSTGFVMDNPFSMASVLALYQKFDDKEYVVKDLHTMRVAASALNSFYPESEHVKALYSNTLQLLEEEKSAKLQQMIREYGESIPEIILPDPSGKEIALSSLSGKVFLLHFWSALDLNSRVFNEALGEAYRKYKSKGFEIYQISVDDSREDWLEAIEKDGLSWINVGDMKGSNHAVRLFNIQSVPFNYLFNKNGDIVARDLKGPALDRAIAKLLN